MTAQHRSSSVATRRGRRLGGLLPVARRRRPQHRAERPAERTALRGERLGLHRA